MASVLGFLFWPAVILLLLLRSRRLNRRHAEVLESFLDLREGVRSLIERLDRLEGRIASLETAAALAPEPESGAASVAVPEITAVVSPVATTTAEAPPTPARARIEPTTQRRPLAEIIGIEASSRPPRAGATVETREVGEERIPGFAERMRDLAQRFIENWTGILGVVVVVAGVTFIGIYTALRLEPFYRFLLTVTAAGAFIAASVVLARRDQWQEFAAWLRSAGAAILLFACAAAGGLPGLGLQWVSAPAPALVLLLAGIAANLALAYSSRLQVLATLHVVLSLLPLAIVPPTTTSLAVASTVTVFGVGLAARGRWDRHLGIVLGAYLLFHALWYLRTGHVLLPDAARYVAAGCAAVVFCAAALAHYRRDYARKEPEPLQVGVHLGNWALLALAMFVYVPAPVERGLALLVFGVLAWRLGRRGHALGISWLHQADTLTAQGFVLLALVSGFDLAPSGSLVLLIAFAETLAFRLVVRRGEDALLDGVSRALPLAAGVLLAVFGLDEAATRSLDQVWLAATLMGGCVLSIAGQKVLGVPSEPGHRDARPGQPGESVGIAGMALGWLAGVLLVIALGAVADRAWMDAAAVVSVVALLLAWRRMRTSGLGDGVVIALVGAHFLSWYELVAGRDWAAAALTPHIAPLTLLAVLAAWLAGPGRARLAAILLLGVDVGLAAFLYFDPLSPLIPGVSWLVLSMVALELANRRVGREAVAVLGLGYGYLLAFLLAYALVIVQTPAYVGALRARVLIEVFGVAVLAYWWFFRPREALATARPWITVHPLFVELILAGVAVTVIVEVAAQWWAVAWVATGLLLLAPAGERLLDARARFYSLLFYWVSVADMAVVMSVLEVPSQQWHAQPEFTSLFAIALQVAYVTRAHRRFALASIEAPRQVPWTDRLMGVIGLRQNLYLWYPLFAGIALFLFWRFDRSVLTLLWAGEAFVIFGLSAWLRENQFRYVALAGLAACLARLIFVDMAEANLALRGVIFIGVGLLMLGMNAIYNRFRARFER